MRPGHAMLLAALSAALPAQAQGQLEKLQEQLQQRDALIQDLMRRVEALEMRSQPASAAAAVPGPAAVPTAVAPPPAPAVAGEEGDTVRALEQALVRQGGLVLPARSVEVEAGYLYTYEGNRALGIVPTPSGPQVAQATARKQRHEASLGFRVGLPWSSQLSLRVPYVHARQTSTAAAVGFDQSDRASGVGDVEVQFSKQLADEARGRPAWLASLTWKPATGDFRPDLPSSGTGFRSLQLGLTAVKRQDPLVFFGGVSYTAVRSGTVAGNDTDPGNTVGLRLGTLLAASPQSSIRVGLDLARTQRTRVNGSAVPGTETFSGVVELGVVSLFDKTRSVDVNVGFGVTPDAPRLRIGVAVPIHLR